MFPRLFETLGLVRDDGGDPLLAYSSPAFFSSATTGGKTLLLGAAGGVVALARFPTVEYLLLKLGTLKFGGGEHICPS